MHSARLAPGPQGQRLRQDRRALGLAARPLPWLAGVAALFTVLQLILVVPGTGLGWDETVYVSQVSPQAPAAFFSAPRARGITFLAAPMAALTASTGLLRAYLAVLSGCGLFAALWVWRRLLPVPVLALAGILFSSLWITVFYGPQVMPNLWVAYGALIAVGCFLRVVRAPAGDPRALLGLGAGLLLAGLMRPSDAVWLALPLGAAALLVREWRRPAVLLVLVLGTAAGCAEWVVEAYLRYGGLAERLHRASEIQGGMGLHLAFDDQLRALEGRSLCRPCEVAWRQPATAVWWFALPVLAAGGVLAAGRRGRGPFSVRDGRTSVALLPALTAVSLAVQYLLLIDYAAPRFLLPSYALLALPVALCLVWLVTGVPRSLRTAVGAAVAVALAAHLAVQFAVLEGVLSRGRATRDAVGRTAAELRREGVRPPCVVSGAEAVRIAFRAGCASRQVRGHDGSITRAGLAATARTLPVAVLVTGANEPPPFARGWRVAPLPHLGGLRDYRAYVSPSATP
ncbi:hypothetical protein AB0C51_02110 [Streptomyces pathocidini]|uniref:hypothetical protein n=1 Tax=Streptomyces pathocidini TaxID=1650571 RepID=UPI0033F7A76D